MTSTITEHHLETKDQLSIGGGPQSLGAHGGQLLALHWGPHMSASAEQREPGFSGVEEVN